MSAYPPARILVVQWADIGDLILTTPALSTLREAFPDAHIGLLTSPHAAPIVEGGGLVDAIHTLPRHAKPWAMLSAFLKLRTERYDTLLLCHALTTRAGSWKYAALAHISGIPRRIGLDNGRGGFLTERLPDHGFGARHQAESWLALTAVLGADASARRAQVVRKPFALPEASKRIALHAGSGGFSLARRWSPEKLAQAAEVLASENGAELIIVGGSGDDSAALGQALTLPALNLTGKTTLPELADVLAQCDLFIGSDSGVMHLAAAVGTPVIAVFGPSNPDAWRPWSPDGLSTVVRSGVACSPCSYVGHALGARDGCAARTCMTLVTAQQVITAGRSLLNGQMPAPSPDRPAEERPFPRVKMLGINVDALTYPQWLDQIGAWVDAGTRLHHICTLNPEFVMVAQQDAVFRAVLERSALNVADGVGLLMGAKLIGQPLPGRITGSDGVSIIAERAAQEGWSLYLLGAAEGIAERTAEILQSRYPGLVIAGTFSGSPRAEHEAELIARVNASGADILFVAYGAPEQDKWIARNSPRLKVKMAMGVGGSFDFIAGIVPRAPEWMRGAGLEWLYRLIRQPWRLKRQLRLPRFVLALLLRRERGAWEPR
jgi:lipopolysaccharide heptosyltransferase II